MLETSEEEQLEALIAEVKRNGFGDDLITADGDSLMTGKATHNVFLFFSERAATDLKSPFPFCLRVVVDRKLKHPRARSTLQSHYFEGGSRVEP